MPHYLSSTGLAGVSFVLILHCTKTVRIWSFSGPFFSAFGMNMDIYGINLLIQSECGKIRTRKTPNMDTFCAVLLCLPCVTLLHRK